jgi:hypothetical protein
MNFKVLYILINLIVKVFLSLFDLRVTLKGNKSYIIILKA